MKYTKETEWARPYIEELKRWMADNRITIRLTGIGDGDRVEHWLIHPNVTDEELVRMCLPYFSHCRNCKWSDKPHPLILSANDGWLHLCTRMAVAMGIVTESDILGEGKKVKVVKLTRKKVKVEKNRKNCKPISHK